MQPSRDKRDGGKPWKGGPFVVLRGRRNADIEDSTKLKFYKFKCIIGIQVTKHLHFCTATFS